MVLTKKWKTAHKNLSPLDVMHARLVSQIYEILTGKQLTNSLGLRKPIEFDYRGRPNIVGSLPFVYSGHFVNHLPNGAMKAPGSFYEYELVYNLELYKAGVYKDEGWTPGKGYVHVVRPDIEWTTIHKASFEAVWDIDGSLTLDPLEVWVRSGYRGNNYRDRVEFRNHLQGTIFTS